MGVERQPLDLSAASLQEGGWPVVLSRFAIAADWYRRCLEDVIDRRVVRGLDEARAGYDAALDDVTARLREAGVWTET